MQTQAFCQYGEALSFNLMIPTEVERRRNARRFERTTLRLQMAAAAETWLKLGPLDRDRLKQAAWGIPASVKGDWEPDAVETLIAGLLLIGMRTVDSMRMPSFD